MLKMLFEYFITMKIIKNIQKDREEKSSNARIVDKDNKSNIKPIKSYDEEINELKAKLQKLELEKQIQELEQN